MTPDEIQALFQIYLWMFDDFVIFFITLVLYGVYLLLFLITIHKFMRQSHSRKNRTYWVVCAISITSFILATLNAAGALLWLATDIRAFFLNYINFPLDEDLELTNKLEFTKIAGLSNWVSYLTRIHIDGIIVWRVWTLFPGKQRWLLIGPVILLITVVATTIAHFVLAYVSTAPPDVAWAIAPQAFSIGTNVSTTMLIAYKFWTHRKTVTHVKKQSRALSILFLMFESGVLYALLQIASLIMSEVNTPSLAVGVVSDFFVATYFSILPMYPTIVIALIYSQRSIEDVYSMGGIPAIPASQDSPSSHDIPPDQEISSSQLSLPGDSTVDNIAEGSRPLEKIQ